MITRWCVGACLFECKPAASYLHKLNFVDQTSEFRHVTEVARPNAPAAILSSIKSAYVFSNPFPSKPSIVFSPLKPFYSQPTIPLGLRLHQSKCYEFGTFWSRIRFPVFTQNMNPESHFPVSWWIRKLLNPELKGAVSPIISSAPKCSSRHFIFNRKCVCFE